MGILHYLDVAIGFTLGMLVLATLIATTTAMWLSAIRSRVRQLENGLHQVLGALGDPLTSAEQLEVAKCLLRDKSMNGWSPIQWLGFGATEAMGREELVLLLLRRAGGDGVWKNVETAIERLTKQKPAEILQAVERAILEEEAEVPSSPANVSRTRALAKAAPGLAAPLFAHFDDVMTRTDDNSAFSGKFVAAILALIFLVIYPVNSFDVLARLMNSDALSKELAEQAAKGGSSNDLLDAVKKQGLFGDVFEPHSRHRQAIDLACHGDPLCTVQTATAAALSEPGVWTTLFLVSLGAPFWQALLDRFLGLRSKITAKTEDERVQRATQT